jgi:hypothetical protein
MEPIEKISTIKVREVGYGFLSAIFIKCVKEKKG